MQNQGEKKPVKGPQKAVSYQLIKTGDLWGRRLYPMLEGLIEKHHHDLIPARFALAWNLSWKPDVDGRVTLGKVKKASDLDRELALYDFVIILRKEFFEDQHVTNEQRLALLDHELCHCAPKLDKDGEQVEDERDRKVWRLRKHDVEEFNDIIVRHGIYKRDLEQFAAALRLARQGKLDLADVAGSVKDVVREAALKLAPKRGSGIDAVSFTTVIDGKKETVTLTPEDRERLERGDHGD